MGINSELRPGFRYLPGGEEDVIMEASPPVLDGPLHNRFCPNGREHLRVSQPCNLLLWEDPWFSCPLHNKIKSSKVNSLFHDELI